MAWQALVEAGSGRLISVGERMTVPPPIGLLLLPLSSRPDFDAVMWDETARAFVARPAKVLVDRLQEILTDPAYADDLHTLWQALNATQRTRLRSALNRLLGGKRWRAASEPLTIE